MTASTVVAELSDRTSATVRVARTITIVNGAGALILGIISLGSILAGTAYLARPFTLVAVSVIFGGYLVLTVITMVSGLRVIRIAHGTYATLFVLVQLAMVPALGRMSFAEGVSPWLLEMAAIGAVCAVVAWDTRTAWAYLLLLSVLEAPLRWLTRHEDGWDVPLQYALLTLILGGLFTALAIAAMRNAAAVDAAANALREAAARSAAATARAQEQARLDALVHDEVMNTLYYASRADAQLEAPLRRQATAALAELEMLRNGRTDVTTGVPPTEFVSRIRSVVLEASIDVDFSAHGVRELDVPGEVAAAFAEATSEAARNSVTHARDALRQVTVRFSPGVIEVRVRDNGPGFDAHEVAPHRLGIPVSIRGRLAAIPGGHATVISERDRGTLVTLTWSES